MFTRPAVVGRLRMALLLTLCQNHTGVLPGNQKKLTGFLLAEMMWHVEEEAEENPSTC